MAFPCLKWCFNKALLAVCSFSSCIFMSLFLLSFLHCRYSVDFTSVYGVHVFGFSGLSLPRLEESTLVNKGQPKLACGMSHGMLKDANHQCQPPVVA